MDKKEIPIFCTLLAIVTIVSLSTFSLYITSKLEKIKNRTKNMEVILDESVRDLKNDIYKLQRNYTYDK